MSVVAVIVAAGRGMRAGGGIPKQYRSLAGAPVLARTVDVFLSHRAVDRVLCAIHPDDRALYDEAVASLRAPKLMAPVHGGESRQDTVRLAIEHLGSSGETDTICLVHDAARPFASSELIDRAIDAAAVHVAAVPGVPVSDTIKQVDGTGTVTGTIDRSVLRAVQTPQMFRLGTLAQAHARASDAGRNDFTDDGALIEWAGGSVHVFAGDPMNTKLTHASDFAEAERRIGAASVPLVVRVATGFDVHAFGPGDHVWIGGLRIAHTTGVLAHSDGDVVLHALTDALLGAIGEGDIGTHFPPSDPQWRGAASDQFLAFAAAEVRARGGRIDHLDVTVLCEVPKIGPHREPMRARIAEIAGVPLTSVSIKATTTEKLGFTGRSEGLAAQAAATVRLPA